MSWMDSWSRPSKHAATPPPLYLLPGGESVPYCHSCGRVIGSRKAQTAKSSQETIKYCSDRCRHQKPNVRDHNIEDTFVSLLNGEDPSVYLQDGTSGMALPRKTDVAPVVKRVKGEPRVTILCGAVEELIFGSRHDPEKVFGRRKNRAKRGLPETGEWKSVDMEDSNPPTFEDYTQDDPEDEKEPIAATLEDEHEHAAIFGGGKARPAQNVSDVNFSVGGERGWVEKIEESEQLKQKRQTGQRRADEREAVRCAARRLCVFGIAEPGEANQNDQENGLAKPRQKKRASGILASQGTERVERRKKCEAVLKEGTVVEPSFAKGEWGIRWRE